MTAQVPSDWQVANRSLTPNLGYPQLLALGTYPLDVTDHNCAHVPVNALEQMRAGDALIWVTDESGGFVGMDLAASGFDPRPPTFGPSSGRDVSIGDLASCLNTPLQGSVRSIGFVQGGRVIAVIVAIGERASESRKSEVFQILNSLTVRPATAATGSPTTTPPSTVR